MLAVDALVPPLETGTTPDTTAGEIFTKSVPLYATAHRSFATNTTPVCPDALNVTVYVPDVLMTMYGFTAVVATVIVILAEAGVAIIIAY